MARYRKDVRDKRNPCYIVYFIHKNANYSFVFLAYGYAPISKEPVHNMENNWRLVEA